MPITVKDLLKLVGAYCWTWDEFSVGGCGGLRLALNGLVPLTHWSFENSD